MGLANRVLFLGHVDNACLYFKAFDVFLMPSRVEGMGLALLEAMVAKIPVVTTSAGGIPEVLPHSTLTALPGSDDSFLSVFKQIISLGPEEKEQMTDNLYTHLKNKFDLPVMEAKYVGLVTSVLSDERVQ